MLPDLFQASLLKPLRAKQLYYALIQTITGERPAAKSGRSRDCCIESREWAAEDETPFVNERTDALKVR